MQMPEVLILEHGTFELPKFQLYGVMVGDIDNSKTWSGYKFSVVGDPTKMRMCTALWRGCVSTYVLRSNGTIHLKQLEYPFTEGVEPDEVDEKLIGDFWLDMRKSFMGDAVRVPFVDGHIEVTESNWRTREGISVGRHR